MPESNTGTTRPVVGFATHRIALAVVLSMATIAICEPFFPSATITTPGLIYLLANIAIALRTGWQGGLASIAVFAAYVVLGPLIPNADYHSTSDNEQRLLWMTILMLIPTILVAIVHARIGKETRRAIQAGHTAELEAGRRRQTEQELRESEEFSRLVVESAMDAIIATDGEGRVLSWNQPAESIFGWQAQEVIGRPLAELIGTRKDPQRTWPYGETATDDEIGIRTEHEARTKGGRVVGIECYAVRHNSSRGTVIITFLRDVSERQASELAIRNLNASLEGRVAERTSELVAKNEELEGFSYAISHDLRTPLRAIVSNARIVLDEEAPRISSDGKTKLERLAAAALRMSALVDDLLEYARIGNRALRVEQVDLSGIADSVVKDLLPTYPDAQISVQSGMQVQGDPMLLSLVLNNLFDNACKYTKPGQAPEVSLTTEDVNGRATFIVQDHGIGIEMEYAHNLFKPFERLHQQLDYPGTGIGLANVRRAVERHGGSVWLDSEKGGGTKVFFTLGTPVPRITASGHGQGVGARADH